MNELERAGIELHNFIVGHISAPDERARLLAELALLEREAEQAQALRLDLETAQAQNIALVSALNNVSRRLGEMVGLGE